MAAMVRAGLCSGSVAISAKQAIPLIERIFGAVCGSGFCAGAASTGRFGCGLYQMSRAADLGVVSSLPVAGAFRPFGASGQLFFRKAIQEMRPSAAKFFAHETISGRVNIFCIGASAGIVLFKAASSTKVIDDDFIDPSELPEDDKDPLKHLLRLVKRMVEKLNKFPPPKVKKGFWFVKYLKEKFGQNATDNIVSVAQVFKNSWSEAYVFVLTALACITLKINIFDGFKIMKIVVLEKRKEIQQMLAAYARAAQRKPEEEDDADKAVAFTVYDLVTQEHYQIVMLMRGKDEDAIRIMLNELATNQPSLPIVLKPGMRVVMKGLEEASLRKMLEHMSKSQPDLLKDYQIAGIALDNPDVRKMLALVAKSMKAISKELNLQPSTPGQHQKPSTPGQHQKPSTPGQHQEGPSPGQHQELPTTSDGKPTPGNDQKPATPGEDKKK